VHKLNQQSFIVSTVNSTQPLLIVFYLYHVLFHCLFQKGSGRVEKV